MRRSALVICTSLALAVVGGGMSPALAAQPVAAGARASALGGPAVSVTLQLAQPRAAALGALAAAKGLARSSRVAQLGALLPSASVRAQVSAAAKAEGFSVVGGTPFSIVVSGPAEQVRAVFGDSTPASPGGPSRDLRVPAAMSGLVGQVVGADGPTVRPLVFTPTATTGPQAAAVYHTTTAAPVAGSSQTIATIQLSGWNPAALTQFAAANGLPDPVASGQYTAVAVGSGSPTTPDGSGGDVEVALDQESILATAPHANQRAYFGSNGSSDFFSAFNAVATDAMSTAPDYHITALSVSWGGCEEQWSSGQMDAFDSSMASLEAAGVEVFVASGDSGSYGCGQPGSPSSHWNSDLSVDFPASSPHVIGVGGTSLDHTTTPSTPVEHVWWHASGAASGEYQGDGGGGGYSAHFSRPSYQASVSSNVHRAVPDISLDGDPASGLLIKRYNGASLQGYQVGGTSLSAPLAAATYTDLLGSAGLSHGIGDIHAALYSAPAAAFRDVTVGSNGAYLATSGFDPASGLGAPLWTELGPSVLPHVTLGVAAYSTSTTIPISVSSPSGTTITGWSAGVGATPADCTSATSGVPPTSVLAPGDGAQNVWVLGQSASSCYPVSATVTVDSVKPVASASASAGTPGTFTWGATDAAPSSGLGSYAVTVTHAGGTVTDYSATTSATSWATPGIPNTQYAISVVAHDKAGNSSDAAVATFLMPASTYHAVDPYRVGDTRSGLGGHGVLAAHASMTLAVVGGASPIPLGASAAALNVTATAATAGGFLSVGPALTTTTSSVNFSANETIPNLVFSKLSPSGTITIYNGGLGSVQVVVDIEGYLSADASGSTYAALAPSRIMDTRKSLGVASAVAPHSSVVLQVTGGSVPGGSPAVALNVTVTRPTASGFLSVAPAKSTTTSNLNFTKGATVANLVVTRLSTPAGSVTIYNGSSGTVHLTADVQGYFVSAPSGSSFAPVAPYRVLDTRHAIGHSGVIAPHGSLVVSVVGGGSPVPAGAKAVIVNVTVVNSTRVGYLSVGPVLSTSTSNLNFLVGEVRPNVVISRLSADTVTIYNGSIGTVDVLADVQGYLIGGS